MTFCLTGQTEATLDKGHVAAKWQWNGKQHEDTEKGSVHMEHGAGGGVVIRYEMVTKTRSEQELDHFSKIL